MTVPCQEVGDEILYEERMIQRDDIIYKICGANVSRIMPDALGYQFDHTIGDKLEV